MSCGGAPEQQRRQPALHYLPPAGWMNDPNGLVYHEGVYHLYFQYVPPGQEGHDKHWGHAAGRDLLSWETLPVALSPDQHGDIWSGSAVHHHADPSRLVAVFTHQRPGDQRQSVAFSSDGGLTWEKHPSNPVLTDPSPDFRDPKVFWHDPTGRWVMVVSLGDRVGFYGSADLLTWDPLGQFGPGVAGIEEGLVWECPDLFPVPDESGRGSGLWALVVSVLEPAIFRRDAEGRRGFGPCAVRHLLGRFDGATFFPEGPAVAMSHGDDYAAVTFADAPDGRRLLLGWMSHWGYAGDLPLPGGVRGGCMTLPRELSARREADGAWTLLQRPPAELAARRGAGVETGPSALAAGAAPLPLGVRGDVLEVEAAFTVPTRGAVGLRVLGAPGGEHVWLGYDADAGRLFIDRSHSGEVGFHPRFADPITSASYRPEGAVVRLHAVVDRCCVELFADDGRAYLSALVFPPTGADGVSAYATGAAELRGARAWLLREEVAG